MGASSPQSAHPSAYSAHHWRGYFLIAAAAFCWALAANLGKAAFGGRLISGMANIDVLTLMQARTTVSVLLLAPLLLLFRGTGALKISPKKAWSCMFLGILGIAGSNYTYYFAVFRTNVATAILLQHLAPSFVYIYRVIRKQEPLSLKRMSIIAMAFVGAALAVGLASGTRIQLDHEGIAVALISALIFAFYTLAGSKEAARTETWLFMFYAMLGASLFWICIQSPAAIAAKQLSSQQWEFLSAFAVLSMLVPFGFFFSGLKYLDPTRAIITSCLEPLFAIVISWAWFGYRMDVLQILGMLAIFTATLLLQL